MQDDDPRRHSPAARRNAPFILDVLRSVLPARGRLLEIASGTGQHAVALAAGLPDWAWQPSDIDADALRSIGAWRDAAALANVLAPLRLDVTAPAWNAPGRFDAVYCANLLHIAPWPTCAALMRGAATHLDRGGLLIVYGPFFVAGEAAAPGNLAFDVDLRARDAEWGVRRLDEVRDEAQRAGLDLREVVPMPANNLTLVFARR